MTGVVLEVKSGARIDLATWMAELDVELFNDDADTGAVVVRPKGKPNVEDSWAVLTVPDPVALYVAAGWLPDR